MQQSNSGEVWCWGVSVCCVVWCVVLWCGVVWCTADERVWRRWLCRDALIVPRFQVPARTQGDQHQCTAVVMIIILWMDCWRCCWLAMMSDKDINIKDLVPDFQFLVIFGWKSFKKKMWLWRAKAAQFELVFCVGGVVLSQQSVHGDVSDWLVVIQRLKIDSKERDWSEYRCIVTKSPPEWLAGY